MDDHHEERLKELTERAWALGYRLITRNHEDVLAGIRDYLLWGVHQRRPILATHTAVALDGNGSIAEMLDEITKLPRYCLQLQDNPGVEVVPTPAGEESSGIPQHAISSCCCQANMRVQRSSSST